MGLSSIVKPCWICILKRFGFQVEFDGRISRLKSANSFYRLLQSKGRTVAVEQVVMDDVQNMRKWDMLRVILLLAYITQQIIVKKEKLEGQVWVEDSANIFWVPTLKPIPTWVPWKNSALTVKVSVVYNKLILSCIPRMIPDL